MMFRALSNWRLYSWIRLTWTSKRELGSMSMPQSFLRNAAALILFSSLIFAKSATKLLSVAKGASLEIWL